MLGCITTACPNFERSILIKIATQEDVHLIYQSGMPYIIWDIQQKGKMNYQEAGLG